MRTAMVGLFIALAAAPCAALGANWESTVAASNPLNWYRFDELNGSTAVDHGSQLLNGTYGNGAFDVARGIPGRVGLAAQFGNQSTVFLSAADVSGDWSAEFVLKRIGSKTSSLLIRGIPLVLPSQGLKLEQYPNTGEIGYTKFGIVDATFEPGASSPLNVWTHIVYVNREAEDRFQLYVDGLLVGTRIDTLNLPRDQIGSGSDAIPESPLAIMDEVVLYSRALSASEIAGHYAALPEPTTAWLYLAGMSIVSVLRDCRRSQVSAMCPC